MSKLQVSLGDFDARILGSRLGFLNGCIRLWKNCVLWREAAVQTVGWWLEREFRKVVRERDEKKKGGKEFFFFYKSDNKL